MVRESEIRPAEIAVVAPDATDAGLVFIGRIDTPWTSHLKTPRQSRSDGPVCRLELFEPWGAAIAGLERYERAEMIDWLHLSRRDLVLQSPANDGTVHDTFALRSPVRPNLPGTSIVHIVGIEGVSVLVRGLDCLDEAPLLDIKPDRTLFTPLDQAACACRRRAALCFMASGSPDRVVRCADMLYARLHTLFIMPG